MVPEVPPVRDDDSVPPGPGMDLDSLFGAPPRPRVLVVDDDSDTVTLLKHILRHNGFDVLGASSASEALRKAAEVSPQVILLDLMMPETDGFQTFQFLREMTDAPVIFISARASKQDVVEGLQLGVDDYITKPFYNDEVVARVRNVLRRSRASQPAQSLIFPKTRLVISLDTQEVTLQGQPVQLTAKEFAILAVLARQAPHNVPYEQLSRQVWGEDSPSVRKRLKYLIYLLRRKIETDPGRPTLIVNHETSGYRLDAS